MPRATIDTGKTFRRELKSCPGGYVVLRTLSFDEMQTRQDVAARMYQEEKVKNVGKGRKQRDDEEVVRGYFEIMNVAAAEFDFRNCIVEHNLYVDDAETQLIDFMKPMYTWKLHPKIGAEISRLIDELNQEDEDSLDPLPEPLSSSSPIEELVEAN